MVYSSAMENSLRHLLLAIQFFTRLPLPAPVMQWVGFSPLLMRNAMGHMPAVGWLVGSTATLVYAGTLWLWGAPVMVMASSTLLLALAALLSTLTTIWLTGAFHEDGLGDVADALGGHTSSERALAIMKDSRVGSYAVVTLIGALLLKVLLLAAIGIVQTGVALSVLVSAHVISRFLPLLLVKALPHVGLEGQSKTFQATGGIQELPIWTAALWCAPLIAFYGLDDGAWKLAIIGAGTLAASVATAGMGWWFKRRLRGITGDCLGATQQVCELVFYGAALSATLHAMSQP